MSDLLKEQEVAEQLGLSLSTIRKWRMYKKGPNFIKIGRAVRYPSSMLKEYLDDSLVPTSKDGN